MPIHKAAHQINQMGYYIVWPEAQGEDRAVRKFVNWITGEAAGMITDQSG